MNFMALINLEKVLNILCGMHISMNLLRGTLLILFANLILFGLYMFSFLWFTDIPYPPLSIDLLVISFPLIMSLIFVLAYSSVAVTTKKCGFFILSRVSQAVVCSMIFWGLVIGIPTTSLTIGGSCDTVLFPLGLFIYTTTTSATGTALIAGYIVCLRSLQSENSP